MQRLTLAGGVPENLKGSIVALGISTAFTSATRRWSGAPSRAGSTNGGR